MKSPILTMLVEDNPVYRDAIHMALTDEPNIELISQFGTAEIALQSIQDPPKCKLPNLILLDLQLPGMSGLEALPHFKKTLPEAKVVILTQSDNQENVLLAISEGADGYLLKSAALDEITHGIQEVMEGGAPLDPSVAKFVLDTLQEKLPQSKIESVLSERELDVLTLLADGLVKKEIAAKLYISYTTVDSHVSRIYEKLRVKNAPSAISTAFRKGILPS